jgi:hypothetical protein
VLDVELVDLVHTARVRAGRWRAEVVIDRPSHGGMLGPAEHWTEDWAVGPARLSRRFRVGLRAGRVTRDDRSGWWRYGSGRSLGRVARVPPDQFDVMVDPSALLLLQPYTELEPGIVAGRTCRRIEMPLGELR